MSRRLISNLLLLCTALIWGAAFTAQSAGMEHIGPWTFNCLRSWIAFAMLAVLMPFLDRIRSDVKKPETREEKSKLLIAGVWCGIFLCAASYFQQTGIQYTTAGKAGFLTALYVILVPIIGIFFHRHTEGKVWIAALIACAGFWFLSVTDEISVGYGDCLLLICSVLFAGHILVIDHFAPQCDGVRTSCLQFLTVAVICTVPMLVLEHPDLSSILSAAVPVLYAGVLSSGAGYTLQIIAQKDADPTEAGMILSLESVFSVLAGFIILHETLSIRELSGCALVFAAVILCQLPSKKK